jgi:uncharacterized protein
MTTIGLLSDTHGHLPDGLYTFFEKCDQIWHAGDFGSLQVWENIEKFKPLRGVYGNIDGTEIRQRCKEIHCEKIEDVTMAMMHIGGYPGRYEKKAKDLIAGTRPKIFITGHSHILKIVWDKKNNLLHINPGAAGNSGFHKVITLVRFVIDGWEIKNLEVFEKNRSR